MHAFLEFLAEIVVEVLGAIPLPRGEWRAVALVGAIVIVIAIIALIVGG